MIIVLIISSICAIDPSLNDKVVEFARASLGKRVGDGQCTSLAVQALRQCGARRPDPVQGVWGEEIKSLREVKAGDILQFENAVFVKQHRREDGALITLTYSYPHHTAIVARVRKRGARPVLVILHQNAGVAGGDEEDLQVVQEWSLDLAAKRSGTVRAYRPVP